MFGGIANSEHDECIRVMHKALDSVPWKSVNTAPFFRIYLKI